MKQYKKMIDSGRQKKKRNRFWQAAAEVLRFPRENACPENVLKTLEGCPNLMKHVAGSAATSNFQIWTPLKRCRAMSTRCERDVNKCQWCFPQCQSENVEKPIGFHRSEMPPLLQTSTRSSELFDTYTQGARGQDVEP